MNRTGIEFLDFTWNPTTGCSIQHEACNNCWAKRMANRLKGRYGYPSDFPFRPTFHINRLHDPIYVRKPSVIGVSFMGDLFHPQITDVMIATIMMTIKEASWHTFVVFTKRPERMKEFFDNAPEEITTLPNLHLYVSAWDQPSLDHNVGYLLDTPAAVRGVSIEPMLGPVDLSFCLPHKFNGEPHCPWCESCIPSGGTSDYWKSRTEDNHGPFLDSVILGGETGPGARRMKYWWAANVRDQAITAGVPFFYKGIGTATVPKSDPIYRTMAGRTWEELP